MLMFERGAHRMIGLRLLEYLGHECVCLPNQWTWRNTNEQMNEQEGVTRQHTG